MGYLQKELKNQTDILLVSFSVNGERQYIIPLRGKGLWGPIWGFISLEEDLNSVFGAVFDHSSETPGLGAEINRASFEDPFSGKSIFEGDEFTSIKVIKGGAEEDDMHGVDGISGGTITSDGVSDMLDERLRMYLSYFSTLKLEMELNNTSAQIDSSLTLNDLITK